MAVIVETGVGVAGANSFVTVAEVDAYALARLNEVWSTTTKDKSACVILAADYLRNETRFHYRGTRVTYTQLMPFPRDSASEGGLVIPSTAVPWRMKDAQCELAMLVAGGTDLQPVLTRGGRVRTKTVDVLSTTWFDDAPNEDVYLMVMGLLTPLIYEAMTDGRFAVPYQVSPVDFTPWVPGEYNRP